MKKLVVIIFLSIIFGLTIFFLKKEKDFSRNIYFGNSENLCVVTISEILKEPKNYDGKTVVIKGYLYTGFEISGLYENKNKLILEQVGICVNLLPLRNIKGDSVPESLYNARGKKVIVIGKYNSKERGHMGNCHGELSNVISITIF